MDDLERRIWGWLPARRDRGRVTQPSVIAANLGVATVDVAAAMDRMARNGQIMPDKSGWHRGAEPC